MELAGITDVAEIATKAAEIIGTVDEDSDGNISRKEWRAAWEDVEALKMFREKVTADHLRAEMVAKYGKSGPEHIPLYAFGNKMSFYRLPLYPTSPDEREGGSNVSTTQLLIKQTHIL